jgi:hypothetical protein
MQGETVPPPCQFKEHERETLPLPFIAFLLGIAGIPHSAKSAGNAGTSTYQAIETVKW